MSVDQLEAQAWWRAVEAAVHHLAGGYDADAAELLRDETFVARLDESVALDPVADAEKFAAVVEGAVAAHAGESYQPEHAPAGSPAGGQFVAPGGGGGGKNPPGRRRGGTRSAPKRSGGTMSRGTGMDGPDEDVRELQQALTKLGFGDADGKPLADDGQFGPKTEAAVKAMQAKYGGMPVDGKVTPELLNRLKAAAAKAGRAKEADEPGDERTTEATDHIEGHVTEALGVDAAGGRVFRVRIIREGVSRNRKRYTGRVLQAAAPLYEGAKAFDHHRTPAEMQTSTVAGLVGGYRNVAYEPGDGLYGDLHLLPSAVHTAEALDASIAAQQAGLPPLVGISHDVLASFKAGQAGGGHVQEAVAITRVHSADVVADPSAGGQATRVLAGGIEPDTEESDVTVTTEAVLAALTSAGDAELAAAGLARVSTSNTTEARQPAGEPKGSFLASLMIGAKVKAAGLPETVQESLTAALPERVTESDIDGQIAAYKAMIAGLERSGLAPTVTTQVVKESRDKVVEGLDKALAGDYSIFRSLKQAYAAYTGYAPRAWGEDENRRILRESAGDYDSALRTTESLTTSSWGEVLGDSITRRMIAMYQAPNLRLWRQIVSDIVPVNDFRTQRRTRVGGYGTLSTVNQGAPYQPLTSPADEEATYAITKKGGTEDLTLETIANDDLGAVARIPRLLGLAAARTLNNFVWDFLSTNPTLYDSVALFHASHANTTAVALSQSNVSTLRQKMRDQTGYGDTSNILSLVPKFLVVPNELEELAFQICTSAVAVPSTAAGPSDTPNLHQGLTPLVVDYFTDANDWYMVADPNQCPTIELGFYQGREEPELFTQNDPTVGSVFNSDTITYKIRHIYNGTVVEYRGMQRGTQ